MKNNDKKEKQYFIHSLSKGLKIFQVLSDAQEPLTLSDISLRAGINKSTATRFCYTLARLGYIHREKSKRYSLTPRLLSLGHGAVIGMEWSKIALFYLNSLAEDIKARVGLLVLDGHEMLYLMRAVRGGRLLPYDVQIGAKFPVYCTSAGKVIMAFGPQEKTNSIIKRLDFRPLTHRTITSMEEFLKEIEEVRRNGFAISNEELSVGLRSVAAPVKDMEGKVVVAINANMPTKRYDLAYLYETVAPRVINAANEISKALIEIGWDFKPQ